MLAERALILFGRDDGKLWKPPGTSGGFDHAPRLCAATRAHFRCVARTDSEAATMAASLVLPVESYVRGIVLAHHHTRLVAPAF